ncbi:MAG: T9SS type A sorting domain-containing protein [Candidatus Cloacimonetes bacterium]|nr:T9SS type A sorting domain-containing protein [Candidatus Cloacimonadota bacterium]
MKKLLLLSIIIFIFCNLFAEAEWTILVYIAADNSLFNAAFDDMNEMESVTYNDSVKIIVQVDPKEDMSSDFDFSEARRYFITYDNDEEQINSDLLANLGEINSADPNEVSEFANWGFSAFPSKKRMLILWDHGDGWRRDGELTKAICSDTDSGDNISVADGELRQAISNINYHLDILAFDACLMQMPEVIGEIYEYCDFVIGSEEEVPWDGFPYGHFIGYYSDGILNYLVENPTCTAEEFSNEIVARYIDSYLGGGSQYYANNISLSSIKTGYFDEFQNKLFAFTSEYSDTLLNYIYENVRENSQVFYNSNIDVYQFFSQLAFYSEFQEVADEILSVMDSLTVNSLAVYDNEVVADIGRMSIYFPETYSGFEDNYKDYIKLNFVQKTRWDKFLNSYFYILPENPVFKFAPNPYIVSKFESGKFIITLNTISNGEIFIYNFAGELVKKFKIFGSDFQTIEKEIYPNDLASGIYFCLLKTGNRTELLKIAIIR